MSRLLPVAIFLFAVSGSSFAQCVSSIYPANRAASICVNSSDPYISASVVSGGVSMWGGGCGGSTGIPQLNANSSSCTFTFNVIHISGVSTSSSGGCGEFRPSFDNSHNPPTINGGTIVVWDTTQGGNDCEVYRSETIAHELGHALGLGDSSCQGYMMGPPQVGGGGRSVQSAECDQVDSLWTTPSENNPPPDPCGFSCQEGHGADSPIVINPGKGAYHLSGAEDPVLFDISAIGHAFWIGWTAAGGDEAFLCLDRDGDGAITNGAEMFGNATPLRNGQRASNGFIALAEYDDNHDGMIDHKDAVWDSLLLWTDRNHDGISQPSEIVKINNSSVLAIALDYHWTGRRDVSGNTFRFESTVWISNGKGQATARPVYDVFFVRVP